MAKSLARVFLKLAFGLSMTAGFALLAVVAEDQSIRGTAIGFILFLALPIVILQWIDAGRELRDVDPSRTVLRAMGRLFGYPQALFGLVCMSIGIAMIPLGIYDFFTERTVPINFAIEGAVGFTVFGAFLYRDSFRSQPQNEIENGNSDDVIQQQDAATRHAFCKGKRRVSGSSKTLGITEN